MDTKTNKEHLIEVDFDNVVYKVAQGNRPKGDGTYEHWHVCPPVEVKAKDLADWCKERGYDSVEAHISIPQTKE